MIYFSGLPSSKMKSSLENRVAGLAGSTRNSDLMDSTLSESASSASNVFKLVTKRMGAFSCIVGNMSLENLVIVYNSNLNVITVL